MYACPLGVIPVGFDASFAGVDGAPRTPLTCGGTPFGLWIPFTDVGVNVGGGLDSEGAAAAYQSLRDIHMGRYDTTHL